MTTDPTQVTLREITADTVRAVIRLSVAESQKGFVAPNATSLSQALFSEEAWYRAVYMGDEPVGFVMLEDKSLRTPPPENFKTLELSYVPGPGCPEPFYLGLGFRHTGRVDEGEIILELPLIQGAV